MLSFAIGRIEGPWTNFVPPIQGGKFRSESDPTPDYPDALSDETLPSTFVLSEAETRSPSPTSSLSSDDQSFLFDPSVRRRTNASSASSVTSISSNPDPVPYSVDMQTRIDLVADQAKYPSTDAATQAGIVDSYRELQRKIEAAGLYNCNYSAYVVELARYALLFGGSMFLLSVGWYKTSAFLLGCFWHQLVFSAHDAGHIAITHNYQIDTVLGILVADFCGGLSLGWWKRSHNVHHIVTNDPAHDPDIEHLPFFAVSHRFFTNLFSTYYDRVLPYDAFAKIVVPFQHYLYYPILCFGRFNLYRLSWEYLILGLGPRRGQAAWHRWLEITGQFFFWTWFGYGLIYSSLPDNSTRFSYVMISHMATMLVHVQITLSHFAMSTSDFGPGESFAQKMLRTTMDVDCPEWLDFFHGGLQFQAVHHLFPRVPRHNLRKAQKFVIEFCKETGIPYSIYGFHDGNKEIIGRLGEVARQAKVMAQCQKVMMEKGEFGHF